MVSRDDGQLLKATDGRKFPGQLKIVALASNNGGQGNKPGSII